MVAFEVSETASRVLFRWMTPLLSVMVAVTACQEAVARTWEDGIRTILRDPPDSRTNKIIYRTYLPKGYDAAQSYPFVLYLHPNGQQGADGNRHVSTVVTPLLGRTYEQYPAIVLAPQAPQGTSWSTPDTRELTKLAIDATFDEYSIDANRLYMTGVSMGGFGTLDYLDHFTNEDPGRYEFAAAASLAAGSSYLGDVSMMAPYDETPIWLYHAVDDGTVTVEASRDAYRSFTGLGPNDPITFDISSPTQSTAISGNIRYTEFPRGGHTGWVPSVYGPSPLYDWMFAQSLSVPEPASAWLVFSVGLATMTRQRRQR